jgi:tRNA(Met) cytidine acetyltransferase
VSDRAPSSTTARYRSCYVAQGTRAQTRAAVVGSLNPVARHVGLWIGLDPHDGWTSLPASRAREALGQSFGVVVLDQHDHLHVDALAMMQGCVWAGGALILRRSVLPTPDSSLHLPGFDISDVGTRLDERLRHHFPPLHPGPIVLERPTMTGSTDQKLAIERMTSLLGTPAIAVVLAARGRGKSHALACTARNAIQLGFSQVGLAVPHPDAARAVLHHPDLGLESVAVLPAATLSRALDLDLLLIDEAAQFPVPLLQTLVAKNPDLTLVFSSTTEGYEGTGRGFGLRFLPWLRSQRRPLHAITMREPIRYAVDDPLERDIHRALLLHDLPPPAPPQGVPIVELRNRVDLAADEGLLEQFMALLVQAHYRTTPADLHRLLDAPNLQTFVASAGGVVLGVNVIALEGALDPTWAVEMEAGIRRIRGHALPDTLVSHSSRPEVASWSMVRSVRLAVRADARRRRIGALLAQAVHQAFQPDLFGTLFSASPDVIAFRRALGYEVVRIGAARGPRTGEPSVVMIRPQTPRARDLVHDLRRRFARDLDVQLALHRADDPMLASSDLEEALQAGLPQADAWTPESASSILRAYAFGPLHFEAAASALEATLALRPQLVHDATPPVQALISARLLARTSWQEAVSKSPYVSVREAQRALKRWVGSTLTNP